MNSNKQTSLRRIVRFTLPALALAMAVLGIWLFPDRVQHAAKPVSVKTESHKGGTPNYDIRDDKEARQTLTALRSGATAGGTTTESTGDQIVRGEARLKRRLPYVKVEYSSSAGTPEIIVPEAAAGKASLARPSGGSNADTLRNFLAQNAPLVGARAEQISELKTASDYTNPDGQLSFVELHQEINGIPVFQGEVKAGFSRSGEMFRVVNNLAADVDAASVSSDFGDPSAAVAAAQRYVDGPENALSLPSVNYERTTANNAVFGEGASATTAEKMYFSTEPGFAVPAWRVLIWEPVNAFYVIVDARSGTLLWRKNITEDQTQPATYNVYTRPNSSAMIPAARNPFPVAPGVLVPNGQQGEAIKRVSVQRVGNEGVYSFNSLGWITDGDTKTDGNAVQAGLDRDGPCPFPQPPCDGIDPNSEAFSATREFRYAYHPLNPISGNGEAPLPTTQTYPGSQFQQGSVTQLFYVANWWHDATYLLGFTEAAGNFQNDNFGRGGLGGDRVRGEGQDSSGTNNANFSTPADGTRPRMQMYIWSGPNPDIDGDFDADVIVHENTHGLSNRLHGNSSGLAIDIARGMGEGFSDFYALCLLSDPAETPVGPYTVGSYDTYLYSSFGTNNNYYGIRRFPYAPISLTGGPNNRPHNPLTFQDIDSTKIGLSDGAYAPAFNSTADEVHNIGEVWASALVEIRARMMHRLGNTEGNRRVLQFVTNGMKVAPLNPTPLSERDAMISAALAGGTAADVSDIWAGFAVRGFGASASIQARGGNSVGGLGTVRVTEAFDLPNLTQSPAITMSDAGGNNNGFPDPGETIIITVPLTNGTGSPARVTTLSLAGSSTQSYGTVAHGATVSRDFAYTVPASAACGSVITLTFTGDSSLGPMSFTRTVAVGTPVATFTENFDSVAAPAVPAEWTVTSSLPTMTFVSTSASSDTPPNSMFASDPDNTGGSTELTSPVIPVDAQAANVSFRHRYNTEAGWDGGVLEISIAGGPFQDIIAAGGTFLQNGYNDFLTTSGGNPVTNRFGWTGNSGGYVTTIVRLPGDAAGQDVQFRWRMGADRNTAPVGGGWNIDTIQFYGDYACSPVPKPSIGSLAGSLLTPENRGLRKARILLTDADGETRKAITGARGTFRFDGLETDRTYTLTVLSRRFVYSPVKIDLSDSVTNIALVPETAGAPGFPNFHRSAPVKE